MTRDRGSARVPLPALAIAIVAVGATAVMALSSFAANPDLALDLVTMAAVFYPSSLLALCVAGAVEALVIGVRHRSRPGRARGRAARAARPAAAQGSIRPRRIA